MAHPTGKHKSECRIATLWACEADKLLSMSRLPALPAELDGKLAAIEQCCRAGQRLSHWLAVLVARARDDYTEPGAWLDDMERRFGWRRAHIHHMRSVGDLFWEMRHSECRIATLLACEADKLLSMSRLPMDQIGPFVDAGDPSLQTRDQVRARVAKWLGATPPARAGLRRPQPSATHQPTFFDELFAACTEEDERSWRINIGMRAQDADQKSRLAAAIRAICAIDEIATRIDTGAGQHLVLASALRTEAEKLEKIRRQS